MLPCRDFKLFEFALKVNHVRSNFAKTWFGCTYRLDKLVDLRSYEFE